MVLLQVGRVVKAHGVQGEVVVELITNRTERVEGGSLLYVTAGEPRGSDGVSRTLRVNNSRAHQGRWIVAFEGIANRAQAESLRGAVLEAEPIADPDALWVHELIGSEVFDTTGRRVGVVTAVEANPASDLLVLDTGSLVPLRFVVGREPARLTISPPPGLLE